MESNDIYNDELLTHRTNFQGNRAAERKSAAVTKSAETFFLGELLDHKPKTFPPIW
jgi:hypothetical protein